MTSRLLLAAILGLLTSPLSAADRFISAPGNDASSNASVEPASSDTTTSAHDLDVTLRTSFEEAVNGEELPLAETPAAAGAGKEREFHSICDCDCTIPPLGNWFDCCGPGCTTECYGDYPCHCSQGKSYLTEDGCWVSNDGYCDVSGYSPLRSDAALRFGWWGTASSGSPNKVGEFQDLKPSQFWDVDAISSDGVRTWDVVLSQLDGEAYDAHVRFFGPNLSARVNFEQYLRRLEHDPLAGYDLNSGVPPTAADKVVTQDLNVGQDYAFRVEQLDSRFKGNITDNLQWKLDLWGQRKFGERQVNATAHCYNIDPPNPAQSAQKCHVLSQSQSIDWLTMEMKPALEANWDNVSVEYSRVMRSFDADDGTTTRNYTRFGFTTANNVIGPEYDYAIVPNNYTQIDRLKINAFLTDENQFYSYLYVGDTKNEFRDTHRYMNGYDLRWINTSFDQVTLTGYTSRYQETNQLPTTYFNAPPLSSPNGYDQASLVHPVNYLRTRAGIKGVWQPFGDENSYYNYGIWDGTSIAGGYEYYQLEREFATYDVNPTPFTQPNTVTNQIEFGPSTRWSKYLQTFTRYRGQFIYIPLIGVSEYSEDEPDVRATFNSNLPEQVHAIEIGGTWTPTDTFMVNAQFNIENSWQHSQYAYFDENNYPIMCTIWYAPTQRLSLTTGYAYFSNWIDQDITLGANRGIPDETESSTWNYAGTNQLVSFNANYAWTENVQLVAGYEWDRGSNTFRVPPSEDPGVNWSLLPSLSDVIVETNRVTAGVDWQPYTYMNWYFRYILFDYDDLSSGQDTGVTHMALGGATVNW